MPEIRFVLNVPNFLTLGRMVLAIPLALACEYGYHLLALGLFTVACITDAFDGLLARRLRCETPWGHLADPIADKLVCFAALVGQLSAFGNRSWFVIPVLLICVYDVFVIYLRRHVSHMPTNNWAKVKTALLMTGLVSGFAAIVIDDALSFAPSIPLLFWEMFALGCACTTLCCASVCAVCSAVAYFYTYLGTTSVHMHPAE